jgi:hypothetical protein
MDPAIRNVLLQLIPGFDEAAEGMPLLPQVGEEPYSRGVGDRFWRAAGKLPGMASHASKAEHIPKAVAAAGAIGISIVFPPALAGAIPVLVAVGVAGQGAGTLVNICASGRAARLGANLYILAEAARVTHERNEGDGMGDPELVEAILLAARLKGVAAAEAGASAAQLGVLVSLKNAPKKVSNAIRKFTERSSRKKGYASIDLSPPDYVDETLLDFAFQSEPADVCAQMAVYMITGKQNHVRPGEIANALRS